MANIPNKFVLLSAIAAATLVIPGTLGPLAFEEAYADHRDNHVEQSARAFQGGQEGLVNANVQAPINANVQDVNVAVVACVLADGPCEAEQD